MDFWRFCFQWFWTVLIVVVDLEQCRVTMWRKWEKYVNSVSVAKYRPLCMCLGHIVCFFPCLGGKLSFVLVGHRSPAFLGCITNWEVMWQLGSCFSSEQRFFEVKVRNWTAGTRLGRLWVLDSSETCSCLSVDFLNMDYDLCFLSSLQRYFLFDCFWCLLAGWFLELLIWLITEGLKSWIAFVLEVWIWEFSILSAANPIGFGVLPVKGICWMSWMGRVTWAACKRTWLPCIYWTRYVQPAVTISPWNKSTWDNSMW